MFLSSSALSSLLLVLVLLLLMVVMVAVLVMVAQGIFAEGKEQPLAIGFTKMSSDEMWVMG